MTDLYSSQELSLSLSDLPHFGSLQFLKGDNYLMRITQYLSYIYLFTVNYDLTFIHRIWFDFGA